MEPFNGRNSAAKLPVNPLAIEPVPEAGAPEFCQVLFLATHTLPESTSTAIPITSFVV